MGYGPSRQMRGAGNYGEQLVQFKLADAQRIANVVGQVEGSRRGRKNSTLPRAAGGGGGGALTTATFSGSWLKGTNKVVNLSDGTATAVNILANVLYAAGTRKCVLAQIDGAFTLISSEC
jgi:hypothetical protein